MVDIEGIDIEFTGHAGFRIKANKLVYIDPYKVEDTDDKADFLLITHEHYDHCSIEDIKKVANKETMVVSVADCQSKLTGLDIKDVKLLVPGQGYQEEGIKVIAVPAYNTNKEFHPKENEWIGFIIEIKGKKIYHAGDTDKIPEMAQLQGIDIAMLPVSGTYVMDVDEAVEAIKIIKPKIAIPMHYGAGVAGTKEDAEKFKEKVEALGVRVEVLD